MIQDVVPRPGYPEPYGLLCAILEDGTIEWRTELWDDLGPEAVTWQARPGGPSIGALLLHIVGAEIFWFERFALGREIGLDDRKTLLSDEIDVDGGVWPEAPFQPMSWYFELQDRYRIRTLEAVRQWPSPETMKEHDGRLRSMRWVFGHVIQHESYHGGQIVMLYDLWKRRAQV